MEPSTELYPYKSRRNVSGREYSLLRCCVGFADDLGQRTESLCGMEMQLWRFLFHHCWFFTTRTHKLSMILLSKQKETHSLNLSSLVYSVMCLIRFLLLSRGFSAWLKQQKAFSDVHNNVELMPAGLVSRLHSSHFDSSLHCFSHSLLHIHSCYISLSCIHTLLT